MQYYPSNMSTHNLSHSTHSISTSDVPITIPGTSEELERPSVDSNKSNSISSSSHHVDPQRHSETHVLRTINSKTKYSRRHLYITLSIFGIIALIAGIVILGLAFGPLSLFRSNNDSSQIHTQSTNMEKMDQLVTIQINASIEMITSNVGWCTSYESILAQQLQIEANRVVLNCSSAIPGIPPEITTIMELRILATTETSNNDTDVIKIASALAEGQDMSNAPVAQAVSVRPTAGIRYVNWNGPWSSCQISCDSMNGYQTRTVQCKAIRRGETVTENSSNADRASRCGMSVTTQSCQPTQQQIQSCRTTNTPSPSITTPSPTTTPSPSTTGTNGLTCINRYTYTSSACTTFAGMGAIPWSNPAGMSTSDSNQRSIQGVAFRYRAPTATSVTLLISKDRNTWSRYQMINEGEDMFYFNLAGSHTGSLYEYDVTTPSGTRDFRDPYCRQVTSEYLVRQGTSGYKQRCIIHADSTTYNWEGLDKPIGWAGTYTSQQQIVSMEIHVGSFAGTLKGMLSKLDYLQYIGINLINLMPLSEFDHTDWGYDPKFPMAIESTYGTYDDLRQLVKEAHRRGMAVGFDTVWNHMDNVNSVFLGYPNNEYYYSGAPALTPWGARPNFSNTFFRQYVMDFINLWTREYKITALRWDSTVCIRRYYNNGNDKSCWNGAATNLNDGWTLMQAANNQMYRNNPNAYSVAEDLQNDPTVTSVNGANFKGQWEDGFHYNLLAALKNANAATLSQLRDSITQSDRASWRVHYLENHDKVSGQNPGDIRAAAAIASAMQKSASSSVVQRIVMLGLGVQLMSAGQPMLFNGQEFAFEQNFAFPKPPAIDWSLIGSYSATSGWSGSGPRRGLTLMARDLIRIRRNLDGNSIALRESNTWNGGNTNQQWTNGGGQVLIWERYNFDSSRPLGSSMLIVLSLHGTAYPIYGIDFPRLGRWRLIFNSEQPRYHPEFTGSNGNNIVGTEYNIQSTFYANLPAYTMLIYTWVGN